MSGTEIPFTINAGETFSATTQVDIVDTGSLSAGAFTVGTASTAAAQTVTANLPLFGLTTQSLDVTSVVVNSIGTAGPFITQGDYFGPGGSTNLDNLGGVTIPNTTTLGITINLNNSLLKAFAGITSVTATAYYVGKDTGGNALFEAIGTVPSADASYVGNNGTLVFDVVVSPKTLGSLTGDTFTTTGGAPVCYAAGTRILTDGGERAIETLRVGDIVVTRSGAARPVRWIGRRHVALDRHPDPSLARPVRFAPGAIAPGVPSRALSVSPDHAVLIADEGGADALVMARMLVNGTSITQPEDAADVTYFHLELDGHDIVCADGAWAETYLDGNNRHFFDDAPATSLHPDLSPARRLADGAGGGLALITDAAVVEAIWHRLAARAAPASTPSPAPARTPATHASLLAGGRLLHPAFAEAGRLVFALPPGTTRVRLLAPADRPSRLRPWLDDRRLLGLPVREVLADGVALPLDGPAFGAGWWAAEGGTAPFRWTAAAAALHLPAETRTLTILLNGAEAPPAHAAA